MSTLFPYPTLVGRIDVDVRQATIDGRTLQPSLISTRERVVALDRVESDDWREGSIELEATLPDEELVDGPWAAATCVAVLSEDSTNTRVVSRLEHDRHDKCWRGEVRVLRSLHLKRATLHVSVVGSYGGVDGRIIGTCDEPWFIDLFARTPARRREIEIVEEDFRDGPRAWLRPFKDVPWLVETAGEFPTVLLNTSLEGIAELLNGTRGPLERSAAGLVAAQIAAEAWTVMFHSALGSLEPDEDGVSQFPAGWQGSVLRSMLPDVFPGLLPADALAEAHRQHGVSHEWAELQSRIHYAAARRAHVAKNLTTAARVVSRAQEGVAR